MEEEEDDSLPVLLYDGDGECEGIKGSSNCETWKKLNFKAKNWPIIKKKEKKGTFPAKKTSWGWA